MSLFLKFYILNTREEPSSRLEKMGAMATPFKGLDKEDQLPLPPGVEEPQSETPPGKAVSIEIHRSFHPSSCTYLKFSYY